MTEALKQIWDKVDRMMGPQRMETEAEHIARDMREGRFPERSDPIQVPVNPKPEAMSDLITAEEAQKLADDCLLAAKVLADTQTFPTGQAVLTDAARTIIALHAQLADAQAAQAMVVERCAEFVERQGTWMQEHNLVGNGYDLVQQGKCLRALAPIDGFALVQELRAGVERLNRWRAEEGEKIKRQAKALTDLTKHCQRIEAENAGLARKIGKVQRGDGDHSQIADLEAKVINQRNELANLMARDGRLAELAAERDRLAAANAVLEARVAGLVEAAEDAEYDLLQWLECSKSLTAAGFNMDGTADVTAKLTAALSHIKRGKTNG